MDDSMMEDGVPEPDSLFIPPETSFSAVLYKFNGDLQHIKSFLERDSSSVNEVDLFPGNSHLHHILMRKQFPVDVIRLLLNYGANVNCENEGQVTPLIVALRYRRNVNIIKLLLEKGANVDLPYTNMICMALNHYTSNDIIRLLLDAGCLLLDECYLHGSVFHCAIARQFRIGSIQDVLQLLIERNANVNAFGTWGTSVLCYALGIGIEASSIELLLAAGGVLRCRKHTNPLLCATNFTGTILRADVVQLLLEQGACVDRYVLTWALRKCINETKAIELLLDHIQGEHSKAARDEMNTVLLLLAAENPHIQLNVVELLLKRGVRINAANKNGDTAFHRFAIHKNVPPSVVKTFLKNGSQINLANVYGNTPLHLAMKHPQRVDTFKLLFVAGARFGVRHSLLTSAMAERDIFPLTNKLIANVDSRKLLLKCYLLENTDFQYQHPRNFDYEEFSKFGADCMREIRNINSKVFYRGHTLREFLSGCSPFQVDAANWEMEAESVLFHRLLRIVAENEFPFFLDIISAKIGRPSMNIKLKKLQVYTYHSDESCMMQKVVLNSEIVHKIAYLLDDDEDLLRFISAFYKPDDHSYAGKVSKVDVHEDK